MKGGDRSGHARLVAAYRQGLGLAAIVVTDGPDGIRVAVEAPEAENQPAAANIQVRWWCRRAGDAADIVAAATARLRRCASEAGADPSRDAADAVARAARQRNIDLFSDEEIEAHATTAIARVDTELEQLRSRGELRSVNKSYQAYRLEAAARGDRVVTYAQWMLSYKENLMRQLAATLRFL